MTSASYLVDQTYFSYSYAPGDQALYTPDSNHGQRFSAYYPPGDPSDYWGSDAKVWPYVYVEFFNSALASSDGTACSTNADTVTPSVQPRLWAAVDRKVPTFAVQVSAADSAAIAAPGGLTGKGLWHAPGGVDRRWEGGTDFNAKSYPNNYTDAIRFMQWLRYNGGRLPQNATTKARRALNIEGITVGGRSGGGHLAAVLMFMPNAAGQLGVGGVYDMNTVPNCCIVSAAMIPWFRQWAQGVTVPHANMFPKAETGSNAEVYAGFDSTLIPGASGASTLYDYQNAASLLYMVGGIGDDYIGPTAYFSLGAPTGFAHYLPIKEGIITDGLEHNSSYGFLLKNLYPGKYSHFVDATGLAFATAYNQKVDGVAGINDNMSSGISDGPFSQFLLKNGRTSRWDTVMPSNGIFHQSRVETIGRMILPPNPARKMTIISNTDATNDLYVGPHQPGALRRIRPGEDYEYKGNGYIWGRASTSTSLYTARQLG